MLAVTTPQIEVDSATRTAEAYCTAKMPSVATSTDLGVDECMSSPEALAAFKKLKTPLKPGPLTSVSSSLSLADSNTSMVEIVTHAMAALTKRMQDGAPAKTLAPSKPAPGSRPHAGRAAGAAAAAAAASAAANAGDAAAGTCAACYKK